MKKPHSLKKRIVISISALAGLAAVAVAVVCLVGTPTSQLSNTQLSDNTLNAIEAATDSDASYQGVSAKENITPSKKITSTTTTTTNSVVNNLTNPYEPTDNPYEPTDNPYEPTDNPYEPTDNPYEPTDNPYEPTVDPTEPQVYLGPEADDNTPVSTAFCATNFANQETNGDVWYWYDTASKTLHLRSDSSDGYTQSKQAAGETPDWYATNVEMTKVVIENGNLSNNYTFLVWYFSRNWQVLCF